MDSATKHRNYETDRKVRFTDDSVNSQQNIHRLEISKATRKRRSRSSEKGKGAVTGFKKSEGDFARPEHAIITKSTIEEEQKPEEIAPVMTPCVEVYVPPSLEEDEQPPINKGNPDNLLQTILRKMTAAVEDYDYHVDMMRGTAAEYNEQERDEVKLAIYDRITDFHDHMLRRDDILRSLAQRLQEGLRESGSKDNMRATQKYFQQELMEQKALRKSQKEVQMALQSAITELLQGKKKRQDHKEMEIFSFDDDGNFNFGNMETKDTNRSMQDWEKKVQELHELLRQLTLEKHDDHTSFITTIDKMAEHIATLTSLFENVLNDYERLKNFVVVLDETMQKLSAQNREVHLMILALEDELSEARSTIVSMEKRYGQHAVQMINKWTITGHGFYEEELEIPQVVIETADAKNESEASSSGNVSQSEVEIAKSSLDIKKKKRRRKRSLSKTRRRSGSKQVAPDMYLNYLLDRDSKLDKASAEISTLKVEINRLKKMGDADKSAEVHNMADDLMGQVLKIGQLKKDLESILHEGSKRESSVTSLQSSQMSSPRAPSPLVVVQRVAPSTSNKMVQVPSKGAVMDDYTSFVLPPIHTSEVKLNMKRSTTFNAIEDLTNNLRFEPQDFPSAETNVISTPDNKSDSYLAQTETVTEHFEEVPLSSKTETSHTTHKTAVGHSFSRLKGLKWRSNKKSLSKKLSAPSRLSLPQIRDVAAIDGKLYLIHNKKENGPPPELSAIEPHSPVQQPRPHAPSSLLACRVNTEKITATKEDLVTSDSITPPASGMPKLETSEANVCREVETSGGSGAESAEWVTMDVCKNLSQDQPLTKVSISSLHADKENAKEKDNQMTPKPTKKTPRSLRPISRPPLVLHYHFSPKILSRHITAREPLNADRNQPPLSHLAKPQPLGLSMRKVDLQPRSMDKPPPAMYSGDFHSPDTSPHSSKPPSAPQKYRSGLYHQQQYSRRQNMNDASKFWQLSFNSSKKSYDTIPEFSHLSDTEDKNMERAFQEQPRYDRSRKAPYNPVKSSLESSGMPLYERKYDKRQKKHRYIDTF